MDEDAPSLQTMASAPLLGRAVCASCNEDIVDKYLLKVKKQTLPDLFFCVCASIFISGLRGSFNLDYGFYFYFSRLRLDLCAFRARAGIHACIYSGPVTVQLIDFS